MSTIRTNAFTPGPWCAKPRDLVNADIRPPNAVFHYVEGAGAYEFVADCSVLDREPVLRTDGDHTTELNDCGWKIRFEYRITSHGSQRCFYVDRDGLQQDQGDATEVSIVSATLISSHQEELALPLSMIPGDLISDYETEISQKIDEEENE